MNNKDLTTKIQDFYIDNWDRIRANKERRLKLCTILLNKLTKEIATSLKEKKPIRELVELLKLNEELEQLILHSEFTLNNGHYETVLKRMQQINKVSENQLERLKKEKLSN